MSIIVTGSLGFIGSHPGVALMENNYSVVIADNLSNSSIDVLDRLTQITGEDVPFYKADVTDEEQVHTIFEQHDIEGVIHFAGYKAVEESVEQPLKYYVYRFLELSTKLNKCKGIIK